MKKVNRAEKIETESGQGNPMCVQSVTEGGGGGEQTKIKWRIRSNLNVELHTVTLSRQTKDLPQLCICMCEVSIGHNNYKQCGGFPQQPICIT